MVRITAFLVAGILVAIYYPMQFPLFKGIVIIAVLLVAYFLLAILQWDEPKTTLLGFIGLVAVSWFGYQLVSVRTASNHPSHFMHTPDTIHNYIAVIRSVPKEKIKSWKVEADVEAIQTSFWKPVTGKVMLYISKDTLPLSWRYGDRLLVRGAPQRLQPPANPGEFDYQRFLSFQNMYHQHFLQLYQVKWIAAAERKGILFYSQQVRAWAMQQINENIRNPQSRAIASALVLGVTDDLDDELLNAYAASGAMHVLAVSGLHVGIIYALLLFLLKPVTKFRGSVWIVAILSLMCLWGFAFVTGLSPSVLRAVTMFSFMAMARPFAQRTNVYNTLASSAFALLLYNPYLIMSVGFQLSYLAVLGIVYLQRPIYQLWDVRSRVGDWIWQITCVSLAAQLATFSLGLLYFHQFPVYFLVSNLLVIPLSTAVLVVGIVLLFFSFIPLIAPLLGKLLSALIYLLNQTIFLTEQLPYSLISNVYITTFQCWLLMGVCLGVLLTFEWKKLIGLYAAIACGILFSMEQWMHHDEMMKEDQWVVYAVNGHTAMDFISDQQAHFVADTALLYNTEKIRFHIKPNRLMHGVRQVHPDTVLSYPINKSLCVTLWHNQVIAHIRHPQEQLPSKATADYLVVSRNAWNYKDIKKEQVRMIVLDGSNTRNYCNKLIKFAKQKEIPVYSVMQQGAFILTTSK